MLRLLLLLMLFGAATSADAQGLPSEAPPASAAAPVAADEALKGLIWSKTAQHVWDANPAKAPAPRPVPWATAAEFKTWCNGPEAQADKSGLMGLKNQVIASFNGGAASAQQLADSIIANVNRAKDRKTELRKVDAKALAADLNSIPGVAGASVPASPPADTTLPIEAAATAPPPQPVVASPAASATPQQPAGFSGFIAQNPAMSLGITFVLGMLAGALLTMVYRRPQPEPLAALRVQPVAEEPRPLRTKPISQHDAHNQAKKEAELLKQASRQPAAPPTPSSTKTSPAKTTPKPPPVPSPPPAAPTPEAVASVPAPPLPPANWYAPAQEGGHIEERKLVAEALPQLPIMLTLDARHPDRATFTLNPHVNQGKLIGDGLEQLRDYFEYELPGRISSVTAAAPGQLVRQGEGWQVAALARLEVR
jgi:hypothetical protein